MGPAPARSRWLPNPKSAGSAADRGLLSGFRGPRSDLPKDRPVVPEIVDHHLIEGPPRQHSRRPEWPYVQHYSSRRISHYPWRYRLAIVSFLKIGQQLPSYVGETKRLVPCAGVSPDNEWNPSLFILDRIAMPQKSMLEERLPVVCRDYDHLRLPIEFLIPCTEELSYRLIDIGCRVCVCFPDRPRSPPALSDLAVMGICPEGCPALGDGMGNECRDN